MQDRKQNARVKHCVGSTSDQKTHSQYNFGSHLKYLSGADHGATADPGDTLPRVSVSLGANPG